LELTDPSWVRSWNNSELEMTLINGSQLNFMGCDFPDRIGSIELSVALIDEAHETSEEAYGMIVGRMSTPLVVDEDWLSHHPELEDYAREWQDIRQVFLVCNPKSKGHWLYRDFIDPKTRLPGRGFYTSNTLTNLNLPLSYLTQNLGNYARPGVTEEILRDTIEAVREGTLDPSGDQLVPLLTPFGQRNLLGHWVSLEGAIYDLDTRLHLQDIPESWGDSGYSLDASWDLEGIPRPSRFFAAVDFGFHHPRIVLGGLYPRNRLGILGYWHGASQDPLEMVKALERIAEQVDLFRVFMPHDQPGVKKLARTALGASKVGNAENPVLSGIGLVQTLLSRKALLIAPSILSGFPKDSRGLCWKELEGYQWDRDSQGVWLDRPKKVDDHFPDAIRYLVASLVKLNYLDPSDTQREPEGSLIDIFKVWEDLET
jgi:hypothetical protein